MESLPNTMNKPDSVFRVVRVGGSLLTWDELLPRLRKWIDEQPPANTVFIAGGGPWVELLRQSAARFHIDEPTAHVLCLRAMSTTANLLAEITQTPVVVSIEEVLKLGSDEVVFDVYYHTEHIDRKKKNALPRSWDVTSDSIAARVASDLGASELVLLKSAECTPEHYRDRKKLSEIGYVDPYFPVASEGLKVRYVNLRTQ